MREFCLIGVILLTLGVVHGVSISSIGGPFSVCISADSLEGDAGTDLQKSISCARFSLSIRNIGINKKWTVFARLSSTDALPSGQILIQRIGTDSDRIEGGKAPITLDFTKKTFFSGRGIASEVLVDAKFSNMTILEASPGTYDTSIIFDVEEN
jgi:hypothetical protein